MSRSFQEDLPPSRVNITLDVFTAGAKRKKELPLKLLILGKLSHQRPSSAIAARERLAVSPKSLDQVLASVAPKLSLQVANRLERNHDSLSVNLTIKSLNEFSPDAICSQVPELRRLLAMRNLLKDLKMSLADNSALRKEIEIVIKDPSRRRKLLQELKEQAPIK